MRNLQKALAKHQQGDSEDLDKYCWKDIRQVLEAGDVKSVRDPRRRTTRRIRLYTRRAGAAILMLCENWSPAATRRCARNS